jgi:hypothetical protein
MMGVHAPPEQTPVEPYLRPTTASGKELEKLLASDRGVSICNWTPRVAEVVLATLLGVAALPVSSSSTVIKYGPGVTPEPIGLAERVSIAAPVVL